ncbi:hypothetical protein GKZ68_06835 [Hymenobacter sp. BRD128]|uniref:hypothetical protein n=1 Tax=Hymenobacter sp. BRD128 TaxID=2675878 RepID=UPI0015666C23|nr:hypothetical protein [Hymenobacter sp. BRD128]QKG56373.1 hypothetical protein GKZ68_06835 [Hymenobacter sp. BRD128]
MNIFDKIFGRKKTIDTAYQTDIKMDTLEDFAKLSSDNRMLALMRFSDRQQVNINHFAIFQFAILSDPNKNVKLTALKRIHAFKEHPDIMPMMKKFMAENDNNGLEPYFSMALSRLGIISLEDLNTKLNS